MFLKQLFVKSVAAYKSALKNHPYLTQAVQVSILMGSGDVIAQTLIEKKTLQDINLRRVAQFSSLGLFLVGPSLRIWYGQLDKLVKIENPVKRTIGKVCLDQLLFAPTFIVIFTSAISTLQGMNLTQISDRLKDDYINILTANYCLWPAAQLVNFYLIPLNYQVVFVQIIAIIWNTYLSLKLGNAEGERSDLNKK